MARDDEAGQKSEKSAREARLAAALRANLRRRKAQERSRSTAGASDERDRGPSPSGDEAGD